MISKKNDKSLFHSLERILFLTWDPISINSNTKLSSEYSSCVPKIMNLLMHGANEQKIEDCLLELETTELGINVSKETRSLSAGKIQECWREHKDLERAIDKWFESKETKGVSFALNDSVEVISGPFKSFRGSLISLIELIPIPKFQMETSSGGTIEVTQDEIEMRDT